ncbi:hypothetical protein G6F57_018857 [Rhizopus arrhizus]|nr:hypothetical protein G6F57_018857 [Rhizopus arrhizus]
MVRDVQLHDAAAQVVQLGRFGVHHHAVFGRGGARGRIAAAAFDLHQAKPAGTERFQAVGGAQLGDVDAGLGGGAHQRRALGDADFLAVDGQGDGFFRDAFGRAQVAVAFDDGF